MKKAPALASRKASRHSRITSSGKQQSNERRPMNQDLISSKDGNFIQQLQAPAPIMLSQKDQANISFIYNGTETPKGQMPRDISTKLYVKTGTSNSRTARLNCESTSPLIGSINMQTHQHPQKRLESMLQSVIPENLSPASPSKKQKPFQQEQDTGAAFNLMDASNNGSLLLKKDGHQDNNNNNSCNRQQQQPILVNIAATTENQKSSLYKDERQFISATGSTPLMTDIEMKIVGPKKSVQHDAAKMLQVIASQKNDRHQKSQKSVLPFGVTHGSGGHLTSIRTNPSGTVNIQVATSPNRESSSQQIFLQNQQYQAQTHSSPSGSHLNNPNATTKVQQQLLRNQANVAMASAKALYQAAKIQRIQIVNKPSSRSRAVYEQEYLSPTSPQNQNQDLALAKRKIVTGATAGLGSNSFAVVGTNQIRDNKLSSAFSSEGKQSSPAATSSQNASPTMEYYSTPLASSYLHFQRFSREGKQILKQIQSATNQTQTNNSGAKTMKKQSTMAVTQSSQQNNVGTGMGASFKQNAAIHANPETKQQQQLQVASTGTGTQYDNNFAALNTPTCGGKVVTLSPNTSCILPIADQQALEVVSQQFQQKSPQKSPINNGSIVKEKIDSGTENPFFSNQKQQQQSHGKLSFSVSPAQRKKTSNMNQNSFQNGIVLTKNSQLNLTTTNFQQTNERMQRKRRTLAGILEPLMTSEEQSQMLLEEDKATVTADKNSDLHQDNLQQLPSAPIKSRNTNGHRSVPHRLPKLQFVVKYANRSRHESTVRYKNMDLQGSRTHIMPLNLIHQNSLYFIQDNELARNNNQFNQQEQISSHAIISKEVRDLVNGENSALDVQNSSQHNMEDDSQQKSARELVQIIPNTSNGLLMNQTTKTNHHNYETQQGLYPSQIDKSSLAWLRQSRRTVGYIRSMQSRPTLLQKTATATMMVQTTPNNSALRKTTVKKEALSSWDNLNDRRTLEKNTGGGITEDQLEAAGSRRPLDPASKAFENQAILSENDGHTQDVDSHHNQTHLSSAAPNSASRGRVSSAADYQNYLLQPKIMPSTSSTNHRPSLAQTTYPSNQFNDFASVDRRKQMDDPNSLQKNQNDQPIINFNATMNNNNNVKAAMTSGQSTINRSPRTSQLEKRTRIIQSGQDSGSNDPSQDLMKPLSLHDNKVIQGQASFPGNFGFQGGMLLQNSRPSKIISHLDSDTKEDSAKVQQQQQLMIMQNQQASGGIYRIEAPGRRHPAPQHPKVTILNKSAKRNNQQKASTSKDGQKEDNFQVSTTEQYANQMHHTQMTNFSNNTSCFYREYIIDKNSLNEGQLSKTNKPFNKRLQGNKRKLMTQKTKIATRRAEQSEFSQEEISSSHQYSKAILGKVAVMDQIQTSALNQNQSQSSSVRDYPAERPIQTRQIGQFSGLNAFLGLHPQSKQSELVRTRIQTLISSGHSPFRDKQRLLPGQTASQSQEHMADHNQTSDGVVLDNGSNNDIGTVLIRDGSHDNSSIYNSGWLGSTNIVDYGSGGVSKIFSNQTSTTFIDPNSDSRKFHRFNYKGVQVMRNGEVSPRFSGDLVLTNIVKDSETTQEILVKDKAGPLSPNTALLKKGAPTPKGKASGVVQKQIVADTFEDHQKSKEQIRGLVNRVTTETVNQGCNAIDGAIDVEVPLIQATNYGNVAIAQQKFVVQVVQTTTSGANKVKNHQLLAKMLQRKETTSLEKLSQVSDDDDDDDGEDVSAQEEIFVEKTEESSKPEGRHTPHGKKVLINQSNEYVEDDEEEEEGQASDQEDQQDDQEDDQITDNDTQMKITQATPSQFELDGLPVATTLQNNIIGSDGVMSSSNSGSVYEQDIQEQVRLPLKAAQVSWRLNNDSVKNEDMQKENESKELAMVTEDKEEESSPGARLGSQGTAKSIKIAKDNIRQAKVRPGINKILPKELVQELVESQGRRQMENWLKSHQDQSPAAREHNRANSSPTREYLLRKFNSSKRKREVNFFKQANSITNAQARIEQSGEILTTSLGQAIQIRIEATSASPTYNNRRNNQIMNTEVPLNYESAGRNFKLQGVNVLTGSKSRQTNN